MIVEWKNSSKQNKLQLAIKIIHLKELKFLNIQVLHSTKIRSTKQIYKKQKTSNKTYFILQTFLQRKIYLE